jgi:metalloendopeptidase OMA1, mitochondrial
MKRPPPAFVARRVHSAPSRFPASLIVRASVAVRNHYRSALRLAIAVLLAFGSGGCDSPSDSGSGEGPGGRAQELALSPRQELATGRKAYEQVLQEYGGRTLPQNHPDTARVTRVVQRLAKAVEIEPLQREIHLRTRGYSFEWEVTAVREQQVNAFCLPAGKIVVFTGILPVAASDDQLATVLAHEMSHALAHHGSERVAREQSGAGVLGSLRYDRRQESEADHIGVFLMAFADFDADAAVAFWQRMQSATGGGGGLPEILSDHPSHETRIADLKLWAPKAKAARQAFNEGRIQPTK